MSTDVEAAPIVATPRAFSPVNESADIESTKLGMTMLGFAADHPDGLFPQSRNVALLLESKDSDGGALYPFCVIQIGRRATKTTSIGATVVGRAMARPGYKCLITAQTGTVASAIVTELGSALENNGYGGYMRKSVDASTGEPVGDGTMRFLRNPGREQVQFENGSIILCVPPTPTAVRSRAADDIWIDEGGEQYGSNGDEFLAAVMPLMATRGDQAQMILSGTPGKSREGDFWKFLEAGRAGSDPDLGILDYSAPDEADPADRDVWRLVHPGPSSIKADGTPLTSMRVLERYFAKMSLPQFAREFLCMWPVDGTTRAVDMQAWNNSEAPQVALPTSFGWAYDCAPDGSSGALVAAWRDEAGKAWLEMIDHRPGTGWLPAVVAQVARDMEQRHPVWYDAIGQNLEVAGRLDAMRPKRRHVGKHAKNGVVPAEAAIVREIAAYRVQHAGQVGLTQAFEGATWRSTENYRLFGRKTSKHDVCPAVAGALALWQYDTEIAGKSERFVISAK